MGAGKKMPTLSLGEKIKYPLGDDAGVSIRNLNKKDLGAVIFGCTKHTIRECFQEQLFGLPALHIPYVQNIQPGLPLFLFNYSDRKLYGIFEAASHGQLGINPYGWTADGSEKTPFPAQVRIRIRKHCPPLLEEHFRQILADNYNRQSYQFWFELDHAQTAALLSLFEALPLRAAVTYTFPVQRTVDGAFNNYSGKQETSDSALKPASFQKVANWVLFKENPHVNARADGENVKSVEADCTYRDYFDTSTRSASTVSYGDDEKEDTGIPETHSDGENLESEEERVYQKLKQIALQRRSLNSSAKDDVEEAFVLSVAPQTHPEDEYTLATMEVSEKCGDISVDASRYLFVIDQLRHEHEETKASLMEQFKRTNDLEMKQACSELELYRLRERVKLLEAELKHTSTASLGEQSLSYGCEPLTEALDEPELGMKVVIFIMGGCDGDNSWLSSVDSYSTSGDVVKCLKPMSAARSYSSAAVSNGRIFNFGGCADLSGRLWYDTVECYDPWNNKWSSCPPLTEAKGGLASAALQNKIYAFGGVNVDGCTSKVEMFDHALGRWIITQSMLEKRAGAAAQELNGVYYVAGGYNGHYYLESAERFDPREASWYKIRSMNTRKASHSIAVLNEKLYVLGGFDGTKMIASVEVFDPRMGSWIVDGEMNQSRGYFFAPVIGDTIYTIGGMKYRESFADVVECYKEGRGWSVTNLKGVGKRSFFSATVY